MALVLFLKAGLAAYVIQTPTFVVAHSRIKVITLFSVTVCYLYSELSQEYYFLDWKFEWLVSDVTQLSAHSNLQRQNQNKYWGMVETRMLILSG